MVFVISISCFTDKKDKNLLVLKEDFFKNDTIQNLFENIVNDINSNSGITIKLFDENNQSYIVVQELDSLFECNVFKGVKFYDGKRILFVNESKRINFEKLIDLEQQNLIDTCNKYILRNKNIIVDSKMFIYRIELDGKLYYYNGKDLVYENGNYHLTSGGK